MKNKLTIEERVAKATRQITQLEARRLLAKSQEALRKKAKIRRQENQRRRVLGRAVMDAGCGDWEVSEIVGVLLDGIERVGSSPTMKLGMKQRGEQHLLSKTSSRTRIVNTATPE